jgi:hypothetical protein
MRFASQFALQQVSLFDDGEILYQGVTNPSSNYNNQKYVYQIKENGKFYTYMAVLCCPNMTLRCMGFASHLYFKKSPLSSVIEKTLSGATIPKTKNDTKSIWK